MTSLSKLLIWAWLSTQPLSVPIEQMTDAPAIHFVIKNEPIVALKINGKKAYFLVDTGASITLVHDRFARHYNFEVVASAQEDQTLAGFGQNTQGIREAKKIDITLAEKKMNVVVYSHDLTNIINSINQRTHIRISGILGSDTLRKYGMMVDYANSQLVMTDTLVK